MVLPAQRYIPNTACMHDSYRKYRKELSAKGTQAMLKAKAEGAWTHKAPLGYRNSRDEQGRAILVPDPETYPTLIYIKKFHLSGMSYRSIQKELRALGLVTRNGSVISKSAVWRAINLH